MNLRRFKREISWGVIHLIILHWQVGPTLQPKTCSRAENMKTRSDALSIAENESGHAKHENGTRRTRHRWKRVRERKTWKRDPTPSVPSKMSSHAQNMKMGPDVLRTAENVSGSAKHENKTRRPRYHQKLVLGEQNMKTGHDALGTAENMSRSRKHEDGIRWPRYRRKWVWARKTWKRNPTHSAPPKMSQRVQNTKMGLPTPSLPPKMTPGAQNMKTGPNTLGTAKNESRSTKHENGNRRPRYR
jgi:hypothetical protein